jgi:hypothetical protein
MLVMKRERFVMVNNEKVFSYSMMSNQVLGILYEVEKKHSIDSSYQVVITKAKKMIDTMKNGDLLQHMETINLNALSSLDNLFMYDYGKTALQKLHVISQEESVQPYLEKLQADFQEIEDQNFENLQELQEFFKVIGDLLRTDLENNYYVESKLQNSLNLERYSF